MTAPAQPRVAPASPRLPRKVKAALDDFQRRVLELFPNEISRIILYGSYARGEATPDSDVDVMVVVKPDGPTQGSAYYLGGPGDSYWQFIVDAAIDSMITYGPYLSALVLDERLFDSNFSVAEDARKEGLTLWKSPSI